MTKKAVIYGVWATHEGVNTQILEVFHNNSGNPGKDRQKFHKTARGQTALLIADGGHLWDTVFTPDGTSHASRAAMRSSSSISQQAISLSSTRTTGTRSPNSIAKLVSESTSVTTNSAPQR